jgi:hypothetical protein
MIRFWRLASGLAVFLSTLFLSAALVVDLAARKFVADTPYFLLIDMLAIVVVIFSFAGSYFLINDARNSK